MYGCMWVYEGEQRIGSGSSHKHPDKCSCSRYLSLFLRFSPPHRISWCPFVKTDAFILFVIPLLTVAFAVYVDKNGKGRTFWCDHAHQDWTQPKAQNFLSRHSTESLCALLFCLTGTGPCLIWAKKEVREPSGGSLWARRHYRILAALRATQGELVMLDRCKDGHEKSQLFRGGTAVLTPKCCMQHRLGDIMLLYTDLCFFTHQSGCLWFGEAIFRQNSVGLN